MAHSNLETLSEIFNDKIFRIPDYQRGYAWIENQIEDFWSDLQNLNEDRTHYTGMITVKKQGEYFHIIDGQQRLATIIILIKAILDNFQNDDWIYDKEKSDYVKKYLFRKTGKTGKTCKVIFGYEKDNPSDCYFKTKILDIVDSDCYDVAEQTLYTKNLQSAKDIFSEKIKEYDKKKLEILFKKITQQLKFNFYELDNELDEFVTFETMNNRGKLLTTMELLKNRLIYLTTLLKNDENEIATLRKDINNSWKIIYEYLGKNSKKIINDDRFLKDHWIMYFTYDRSEASAEKEFLLNKHFIQKNIELFEKMQVKDLGKRFGTEFNKILKTKSLETLKDWLTEKQIDYDSIKNYTSNIQKAIVEYYYMETPEESNYDERVKKWLSKLNRVGFGAFRPIIMAILIAKVDANKIVEILKMAEKYVFIVFKVSDRRSSTGNSRFYKYAHDFHKEGNIDNLIENIKNEIFNDDNTYKWLNLGNFETEINEHFKKNNGWYSWKGLRYLLYEYELFLQEEAKGETKLQWEEINKETIEHIYPQNPEDECWKNDYSSLSKEIKKRKSHTLGNLLLLSNRKNSALKNNCFNKKNYDKKNKKEVFAKGSFSDIEVSQNENWTSEEIDNRSKKILRFLSDRWDLEINPEIINKII